MKVFMVGGTGLLGEKAANILIERGHKVVAVALPPIPVGAPIPKEMKLILCDINETSDEKVLEMMKGCDCFIFASGIDERVECPAPVYDWYNNRSVWQDYGRLFLCLGSMLSMHVTKTIESRTQCKHCDKVTDG